MRHDLSGTYSYGGQDPQNESEVETIAAFRQTMRTRLGLSTLHCVKENFVGLLLLDLESLEWRVRVEAVRQLERLGKATPILPLLTALRDEEAPVRATAARVLGKLGERAPRAELILALRDREWSVRTAIIQALGELGENVPVDTLLSALQDEDFSVREAAVWALGKLGSHVPVEIFEQAFQDSDEMVRIAAATVLGKRESFTSMRILMQGLEHEQEVVRAEITDVLGTLRGKRPDVFLREMLQFPDEMVRASAAKALGEREEQASIGPLVEALRDTSAAVREAAAEALGNLGKRVPVAPLVETLHDENKAVSSRAAHSLAKLGERSPIAFLLQCLKDLLRDTPGEVSSKWLNTPNGHVFVLFCSHEREEAPLHEVLLKTLSRFTQIERLGIALANTNEAFRSIAQQAQAMLVGHPGAELLLATGAFAQQDKSQPPVQVVFSSVSYNGVEERQERQSQSSEEPTREKKLPLLDQLDSAWTNTWGKPVCEQTRELTDLKLWHEASTEPVPPWMLYDQAGDAFWHSGLS